MLRPIVLLSFLLMAAVGFAQADAAGNESFVQGKLCESASNANQTYNELSSMKPGSFSERNHKLLKKKKRRARIRRGVAVALAIFLGPFGVHRLYLGTSETVPLLYTITLGGLMLLPLIDIFCILFTKDLDKYLGNEQVIMW